MVKASSRRVKLTRHLSVRKNGIVFNIIQHPLIYLMALPVIAYYVIFKYLPMYGVIIAFKNYVPSKSIWDCNWVGFKHFETFFRSPYFSRLVSNTLLINLKELVFSFPVPILFAILLNEVRSRKFQRIAQAVTYVPRFISTVVICGLLTTFCQSNGFLTQIFSLFTGEKVNILTRKEYFQGLFVGTIVWSTFGWDSIIYFAALTGVDPTLYDAAKVDGAGRFRQAVSVTLPGILPTIVVMLILRIGSMMSVSWDMIILLYNPMTYETADVLSTYVYRMGITKMNYSLSTAVGLFNSVVNVVLLFLANWISKRVTESSLW